MSYELYKTEAIVFGGTNVKESDRYLYLLTREFGLVGAVAPGLRELKSKLRYSLQDFSCSTVELVYGKTGWRITNAQLVEHFGYPLTTENYRGVEAISRIAQLIRKLCRGEEKNEFLYFDARNALPLFSNWKLTQEQIASLEIIVIMRVLHHLGYWGENEALYSYLLGDISNEVLTSLKPVKPIAIRAINESLRAAQL